MNSGVYSCLTLWVILTQWSFGQSQDQSVFNDDPCSNFESSCSVCIRQPGCQWCSKSINGSSGQHCFSLENDLQKLCRSVENPQNTDPVYIENRELTEVKKGSKIDYENIVQLKPQHIHLELRKGVPVNITMTYRQVKDYPLDLYYLMDLSKSMLPDKKTLALLGKELAQTMRNLTSQFRLGFGSFVDKVMSPFVNVHPTALKTPCPDIACATPFSFRNNLKLNERDDEFTKRVKDAQISSNLDSPEGGFDALMQAMVCEEQIGWRKNVRKIIVLSTDAPFHFAGDGKLAGVITPNDMQCHLNEDGFYDMYDVFDYPSISQIDEVAQEKGINIIFAVKGHADLYKKLSERIKDSSYGELTAESSNVIDLVTKVYNGITGKVEIGEKTSIPDSPVSLRYFSSCGSGRGVAQTDVCTDVTEGKTFDFSVEITVTDCPRDGSRKKTLEIGTLQDSVLVDLTLLCDCDCERPEHPDFEVDSADCSRKGTKQCEICNCNEGSYGKQCQCSRARSSTDVILKSDPNKCRPEGSNSSVPVCYGRGRCECEICNCWNENYSGTFCQCNKAMCRQQVDSDVLCSGHGKCDCGRCICYPGWQGQFCECQDSVSCYPNYGGPLCSGNGDCKCGRCECKVSYTGKFCEECPTCGDGKCLEFRPCVQCIVWQSGELYKNDCKNCSKGDIQTLESLRGPLSEWARLCTFRDENTGCDFNFTYKYIDAEKGYAIYAQSRQKCPERVDILAIAFGVIAGIVAIGILTLVIWKFVTTIHDQREFEKFEKESKNPSWTTDNNPLYKSPTTTVSNPGFTGQ